MAVDQAQLIEELAEELGKIAGTGVSEAKARDGLPKLRQILAVPEGSPTPRAQQLIKQRLRGRIDAIIGDQWILDPPVKVEADALRDALSCLFQLSHPDLKAYSAYKHAYEKRWAYAVDRLRLQMAQRTLRQKCQPLMHCLACQLTAPPQQSDGLMHERVQLIISLDDQGTPTEATVIETARCVREGADRSSFPVDYSSDPAWAAVKVEPLSGLIEIYRQDIKNRRILKLVPTFRPLRPGDEISYSFRIVFMGAEPVKRHLYHCRYVRYNRSSLEIRFSPKRVPLRVWTLAGIAPHSLDEISDGPPIASPNRMTYSCDFSDCETGLAYGLGWEWQSESSKRTRKSA
ncbi:hypothetical protein [Kitasatospora sp. NPDC050463]|uniref:hypothetical protein n=1 Tax=Kitasatospora sp. NPDC050463 TaxID=3155786 RepID=UPI0033E3DAD6